MHQSSSAGPKDEQPLRRTTVAASRDALDTLAAEAARRGVSLTTVPAEAIEEKAASLRQNRLRLGVAGNSGRSAGARELTAEPIADDPR